MFVTLIYCDDGESNSRTVCPKTGCRVQNCRQAVRLKRVVVVVPTKKEGYGARKRYESTVVYQK